MNINILMIASAVVVLSSCSSAYKTGQTPDDIYYSAPAEQITGSRNGDEYVAVRKSGDRYSPNSDRYEDEDVYRNDRWLRMSIGSPYRLSAFNDYYWNDWRYGGMGGIGYGSYGGFGLDFGYGSYGALNSWYNPWGSSIYWNSFYNPYAYNYNPYGHWGGVGVISNPKPPVYNTNPGRSSVFNPRAYTNTGSRAASNTNSSGSRTYYNPRTGTYSNYNNTNSATSGSRSANTSGRARATTNTYYDTRQNGSSNRNQSYTPSNQGSSGRPERTYTPAPSSQSSGSGGARGSSGGSGEVRRPGRN